MEIHVPASRSLKAKRQVVWRILDRARSRFQVAAAEVGGQKTWQRAELGFAVVSGDKRHADEMIDKIVRFVESLQLAPVVSCQKEVLNFGKVMADDDSRWDQFIDADEDPQDDPDPWEKHP